ncbi:hypothetical protein MSL71_17090 [Desulfoluna butyratoxydans]|uniref:Uncharacterized protein n=1 Tax=Desulfoluna butyratoxydans TaxID=231438 RepID=A0A4U8YJU9_9BACT|nr:hypothetical protein MSL71_17090 [Desulfoluna butyratoxydans]
MPSPIPAPQEKCLRGKRNTCVSSFHAPSFPYPKPLPFQHIVPYHPDLVRLLLFLLGNDVFGCASWPQDAARS